MKNNLIASILIISAALVLIGTNVSATESTTVDFAIGPEEYDGSPLIFLGTDTVEMKVESDEPVDVYIISLVEVQDVDSGEFDYEEKWEGETNLDVNYQVDDPQTQYYILIINPSETETANVEVEYKFFEEVAEEVVEDAVSGICCGSTIIAGIVLISALIMIGLYVKQRN